MTAIVRIEHPAEDSEALRRAFDSDPLTVRDTAPAATGSCARRTIGRYVVARRTIARYVLIDLEFDDVRSAQSMLGGLWERFHVMRNPRARIVEVVEERALAGSAGAA